MTSYQLLRIKQVEARTGLNRSQIYAWMKEGHFPQSIKIGPASVAWIEKEIDEWVEKKLSLRSLRPLNRSNSHE
ncbi:AlpA family transcriptional regulator [Citrobacter portucalensis]|uniref:AlpA family transcriptional regulator n=1 Tax=Citrobacter portucalensis TaxID=1639133 RepID=UPI00226B56A3|nr:AlpA family transcriptional regulator [Citrobacter portucalensis]MCX8985936.1 AlpA family transcriptional regulator [Citrobacter portucalensis]